MQKLKKSWRLYGDLLALCICLVNISLFINIALSREEWAYIFVAFLWAVVGVRWLWDAISRLVNSKLNIPE